MNIIEQIEADLRGGVIAVLMALESRIAELEIQLAPTKPSAPGKTEASPPA